MPASTEETIDIENSGNAVSLRLGGATTVSVHVRGDGTAEYQWDARTRGGTWIQDVDVSYTGSADYDDVIESGDAELRLRCSSGTGTAGDSATVTIMASG